MAAVDNSTKDLADSSLESSSSGVTFGRAINRKTVTIALFLLLSVPAMVLIFSLQGKLHERNKTYSNIATNLQVLAQQITVEALKTTDIEPSAFDRLEARQKQFIAGLKTLENGVPRIDLPPISTIFGDQHAQLLKTWADYNRDLTAVIEAKDSISVIAENSIQIKESLPELTSLARLVFDEVVGGNAPPDNIVAAARQLNLMLSIESSLIRMLSDGGAVMSSADQLSAAAAQAETLLLAMLEGNQTLNVTKFSGNLVIGGLVKFADLYSVMRKNLRQVFLKSAQIFRLRETVQKLDASNPLLHDALNNLNLAIDRSDQKIKQFSIAGYALGVLTLILMVALVLIIVRNSHSSLAESQEQYDKNQRAILRLLDEMANLADGDLSTHTTVTEDITGAIADSVNFSIDALRDLVGTINNTANQVRTAVRKTQNMTGELAKASDTQARQISAANQAVNRISTSMSDISNRANDSAEVARKSVSIAHNGSETVRQTIKGMETIREQIQETSKRIKRLGESSQEIGDIVNLITEISDQTNILALNAAIQASTAGEAGRGFAVVADEVQRLAERTGDATKQIEALVKTIQADTNEATVSMEQSTANVVKGAKLTENAGGALDRIEKVSMNLAQRILEISDSTRDQATESAKINETMNMIHQITARTSQGSNRASEAIGQLSNMIKVMQKSVAGFKLPGVESMANTLVQNVDDSSKPETPPPSSE